MADKQSEVVTGTPKAGTAPPRNNLVDEPVLYKGSRAAHLRNQDPNFEYEWKSIDDSHPKSLRSTGQLDRHETGTDIGGRCMVDGWEVCTSDNDKVRRLGTRDDEGKPVDTVIRRGRQVLCRLPKTEHAKYGIAEKAYQAAREKAIYTPERQGDGVVSMTAVVSRDENADTSRMLRAAGHFVPGA